MKDKSTYSLKLTSNVGKVTPKKSKTKSEEQKQTNKKRSGKEKTKQKFMKERGNHCSSLSLVWAWKDQLW